MIELNDLLDLKAKYEKEKLFIEAKLAVINELYDSAAAKCYAEATSTADEAIEEPADLSANNEIEGV